MTSIILTLALAAATPHAPIPLQPMTYEDGEATHTVGTGCSWKTKTLKGKGWLISMHKDIAAVRMSGGLRTLKPAKDAKDLFPFTYDRWTDGRGNVISVRETGKSRQIGTEAVETLAALDIGTGGVTRSWHGLLNCGS